MHPKTAPNHFPNTSMKASYPTSDSHFCMNSTVFCTHFSSTSKIIVAYSVCFGHCCLFHVKFLFLSSWVFFLNEIRLDNIRESTWPNHDIFHRILRARTVLHIVARLRQKYLFWKKRPILSNTMCVFCFGSFFCVCVLAFSLHFSITFWHFFNHFFPITFINHFFVVTFFESLQIQWITKWWKKWSKKVIQKTLQEGTQPQNKSQTNHKQTPKGTNKTHTLSLFLHPKENKTHTPQNVCYWCLCLWLLLFCCVCFLCVSFPCLYVVDLWDCMFVLFFSVVVIVLFLRVCSVLRHFFRITIISHFFFFFFDHLFPSLFSTQCLFVIHVFSHSVQAFFSRPSFQSHVFFFFQSFFQ